MTSKSNFTFNVKPKTTITQVRDLEKETVHFAANNVDFESVQVLLNSNKYLFLEDPIDELSRYLRISRDSFIGFIEVRKKGSGFIPYLDIAAFEAVRLDSQFSQIGEIDVSRRPVVDLKHSSVAGWSYKSRNGAILELFVYRTYTCVMATIG